MRIVVNFLQEAMREAEAREEEKSLVERVREKYGLKESDSTRWLREQADIREGWDKQQAWDELSEKQRDYAKQLNLTVEDMDERTFANMAHPDFSVALCCLICKIIVGFVYFLN